MIDKVMYSVVVPLYNEEMVIAESYRRIKKVMESTDKNYEIIFVNDGSKDKTEFLVEAICENDPKIKLINFSRNFGHQCAVTAGLQYVTGDAIVIIDADLQDPPELIPEMLKLWENGNEVIYGKRKSRKV